MCAMLLQKLSQHAARKRALKAPQRRVPPGRRAAITAWPANDPGPEAMWCHLLQGPAPIRNNAGILYGINDMRFEQFNLPQVPAPGKLLDIRSWPDSA